MRDLQALHSVNSRRVLPSTEKNTKICAKKAKKALDLPLGLRCILIGKSANRKGFLYENQGCREADRIDSEKHTLL